MPSTEPYRLVDHCRVCGGGLVLVLDLGKQYIATYFDKPGETIPHRERIPLELCECERCGIWQLSVTVDRELLYRRYWYRSGVNRTMREALMSVVMEGMAEVQFGSDDRVVDIGSNDWTLLKCYPDWVHKIGIEPSQIPLERKPPHNSTLVNEFFSGQTFEAKIVTAVAMLYDLDDPRAFLRGVANTLTPDGVFVAQLSYLPLMLRQVAFDNICHEHLFYYSLSDLIELFGECGLHLYQASLNNVNGGSIRVVASKEAREPDVSVEEILGEYEEDLSFQKRVFPQQVRDRVRKVKTYLEARKAEGKSISLLGASTKGNVFLQYADIGSSLVSFAAERNPDKWGARTLGTGIPIVDEKQEAEVKLVMPWHFLPEIAERERWDYGQELVAALPDFLTLTSDDHEAKLQVFQSGLCLPS